MVRQFAEVLVAAAQHLLVGEAQVCAVRPQLFGPHDDFDLLVRLVSRMKRQNLNRSFRFSITAFYHATDSTDSRSWRRWGR